MSCCKAERGRVSSLAVYPGTQELDILYPELKLLPSNIVYSCFEWQIENTTDRMTCGIWVATDSGDSVDNLKVAPRPGLEPGTQ